MKKPGFTAATSLYQSDSQYRMKHEHIQVHEGVVTSDVHWGDLKRGCSKPGQAKYSAILWDIPWGQSWEKTCPQSPAPAGTAVAGKLPDSCKNTGSNMWGEWYNQESCCTCVPKVYMGDGVDGINIDLCGEKNC